MGIRLLRDKKGNLVWMPTTVEILMAVTICVLSFGLIEIRWNHNSLKEVSTPEPITVYTNDFNGPVGSSYPEWTSKAIKFDKTKTKETGTLPAPKVVTVESPNRKQRFLGEFGGPAIGRPTDPDWNRTRVDQTIELALKDLKAHSKVTVDFDLYILKSWDGDSPQFGPDRFLLRVGDAGPTLLDATFSNNPKVKEDGSYQSYPADSKEKKKLPQSGATSTGTLGYSNFFKDSIYHFSFTFAHDKSDLKFEFTSSLFEGKGTDDESWGLDNVVVKITATLPANG